MSGPEERPLYMEQQIEDLTYLIELLSQANNNLKSQLDAAREMHQGDQDLIDHIDQLEEVTKLAAQKQKEIETVVKHNSEVNAENMKFQGAFSKIYAVLGNVLPNEHRETALMKEFALSLGSNQMELIKKWCKVKNRDVTSFTLRDIPLFVQDCIAAWEEKEKQRHRNAPRDDNLDKMRLWIAKVNEIDKQADFKKMERETLLRLKKLYVNLFGDEALEKLPDSTLPGELTGRYTVLKNDIERYTGSMLPNAQPMGATRQYTLHMITTRIRAL